MFAKCIGNYTLVAYNFTVAYFIILDDAINIGFSKFSMRNFIF